MPDPVQALAHGSDGGERILRVVLAPERRDATERRELDGQRLAIAADDRIFEKTVARSDRFFGAEGNRRSLLNTPLQHRQSELIVEADRRNFGAINEALFDRRIIFDRPVPVEMIRRDVQHHADGRLQRRSQIDLKRRQFDHVKTLWRRVVERQHGAPDITAELYVAARVTENVRDQRRRRRLAVGAGDADEWRIRRMRGTFPRENLDIADDLDTAVLRHAHGPVRLGMRQRHARSENQRRKLRPVSLG